MTTTTSKEGSFLFLSTRYWHVRPDGDLYPKVVAAWSGLKIDPFVYLCNRHKRIADVNAYDRPISGNGTAHYVVDVKPPSREDDGIPFRSDPVWILLDLEREAYALIRKGVIER